MNLLHWQRWSCLLFLKAILRFWVPPSPWLHPGFYQECLCNESSILHRASRSYKFQINLRDTLYRSWKHWWGFPKCLLISFHQSSRTCCNSGSLHLCRLLHILLFANLCPRLLVLCNFSFCFRSWHNLPTMSSRLFLYISFIKSHIEDQCEAQLIRHQLKSHFPVNVTFINFRNTVFQTLWASMIKAVPKLDKSESGQMVSEKDLFSCLWQR